MACCTGSTCPFFMGGCLSTWFHHNWYWRSIVTYSGALGTSVSAKAFFASDPMAMWSCRQDMAQNVRAPD